MAKQRRRNDKRFEAPDASVAPYQAPVRELKPRTKAQAALIKAISNNQLVFTTGPAGTGKTYVAAAMAADAMRDDPNLRLILVRPVVEAGEELGFLPGTLEEKYAPYLAPFFQVLEERLSPGTVKYFQKTKRIDPQPLAYMRGTTFRDCWVILDEAQNTTPKQMKMFLSRIGEDAKVIVNGDTEQVDIQTLSGLEDAVERLQSVPSVAHIHFGDHDIVRSGLVRHIISAYRG